MPASGEILDLPRPDGASLRTELFMPSGGGPHPGVVVLHESFGLNDDIRRIARRFAGAGYAALAPDLYSHGSRIVCLSRVIADMVRGSAEREIADIHAAREALALRPRGGPRADRRGRVLPGRRLRPDRRNPSRFLGGGRQLRHGARGALGARRRVSGRGELRSPRQDARTKMAERLEGHLEALGVPHDVRTYDGAGHSFFSQVDGWQGWLARMPSPMAVGYDEDAAEDGWRRMLGFFEEHVRGA